MVEIHLQTGDARFNSQPKMQPQGGVLPAIGPKLLLGRAAERRIRICMIAVGGEEYKQKLINYCALKKISFFTLKVEFEPDAPLSPLLLGN